MKTMEKDKCEWCEERRYKYIRSEERDTLYCMNLDKGDGGYLMAIYRQKPPEAIWNRKFIRHINYCPFCGKKLESKGENNENNESN